MKHFLYNAALTLASPVVALYLAVRPQHRPLLRRFSPHIPAELAQPPIWVHACSLGEVNTAVPLLQGLRAAYPDLPLALTVSTRSGMEHALEVAQEFHPLWFPFDAPLSVRGFLNRLSPRMLILIETELWPNVLRQCHRRGIPMALVNGRISQKHFQRYQRRRSFFAPLLQNLSLAAMQSDQDCQRIESLGVPHDQTIITGNIKFDGAPHMPGHAANQAWREALRISPDAPVVTFGSTRPGDEALAAQCIQALQPKYPEIRWIIAPRHLNRLAEVRDALADLPATMRSSLTGNKSTDRGGSVIVLDTLGELQQCYAISTLAVIGGSFYPGVEGHNPIESASMGIPTVFGPYMGNFAAASEALVGAQGAAQIDAPDALLATLDSYLQDDGRRRSLGSCGRDAVRQNQGALKKTIDALRPWLT